VFSDDIVAAVMHHMNDDHAADNLLIARAFGNHDADTAHMVHLDGLAGYWVYTAGDSPEQALRVEWSQPISERAEIRREIVVLYDRACAILGVEPRPHD
jgi:hypothetical protein